jgi:hypothetical protein
MKFKTGIGIIILTFIGSLNPYWLIFTVPVFLLGALLVFISSKPTKTKILWTVIPVLAWYPGMQLFFYLSGTIGTATAQKIDMIFPSDFKGRAIIVSEMTCGQPAEIVGEREQLFFPDNGILLYQGEIETGYVNHKYYFLDPNGFKIEIPRRDLSMYWDSEPNKPDSTITGIWLGGMGSKHINHPEPVTEFSFMFLTVASKDNRNDYFDFHYLKQFENETDSLVQSCKKEIKN